MLLSTNTTDFCQHLHACATFSGYLVVWSCNNQLYTHTFTGAPKVITEINDDWDPLFLRQVSTNVVLFAIDRHDDTMFIFIDENGDLISQHTLSTNGTIVDVVYHAKWYIHVYSSNNNCLQLHCSEQLCSAEPTIVHTYTNVFSIPIILRREESYIASWLDKNGKLILVSARYKHDILGSRIEQSSPDAYYLTGCWVNKNTLVIGGINRHGVLCLNYYSINEKLLLSAITAHYWKSIDYMVSSYNLESVGKGFMLTLESDDYSFYQRFTHLGMQLYPPLPVCTDISKIYDLPIVVHNGSKDALCVYTLEEDSESQVHGLWIPIDCITEISKLTLQDTVHTATL